MRRSPLLLLPLVLLGLSGCVLVDFSEGQIVAVDHIPDIVPGKTTKKEVLDWFGAPQGLADASFFENYLVDQELAPGPVVTLPFADVLVYRFTKGTVRGLITIVWNYGRFDIKSDTLTVFFDDKDVVLYYGYRKGTDDLF
ncbi:MAG TPA: hypothetical protein VMR31_00360 [Myxococcota bacterium]|nr:hypothetical protein [Myxococcota bacterium]